MSRILVACYSLTGHTATVAQAIATRLAADIDMIREPATAPPRRGHFRSVLDVWFKRVPPIEPAAHAPANYDLVIAGCPVWASHMAAPMRSYITRLAVFCTAGGIGGRSTMNAMEALVGRPAEARLFVREPALKSDAYKAQVDAFAAAIRAALG
jgi:flavodoxin